MQRKRYSGEIKQALGHYYTSVNEVMDQFIDVYYDNEIGDLEWVEIGGVIRINDEWWDFRDMVDALKLKAPKDKLFKWKNYCMVEYENNRTPINLKNFLNEKQISQSKNRIQRLPVRLKKGKPKGSRA